MTEPEHLSFSTDQTVRNAHQVMAERREVCPVGRVSAGRHGEGWLITRYEDVMSVLADPQVKRDVRNVPGDQPDHGSRSLSYLDQPDHTRVRRLVNKTFTPRAVEPLAPRVEKLADDLLERMADAGEVDLVAEFAVPIPLFVICELLGVPDQDRADFREWSEALNGTTRGEAQDAKREKAFDYLRELVARKRADPGSDLLSALSMAAADDGSRLSEEELLDTALLLLVAGHDTTVYLIANTILALLQAPEQMAALCADPTLVPAAIEETLRYDSPVNLPPQQYTAEPITLSGTTLPAGEMLLVSVLSANRDAAQFADPDRFDIHRDQNGKHIAFGHGIHYCPGAPLARMEARIAVGKLIHRFPDMRLAVRPDELTMRNSLLMHGPQKLPLRLS